MAQPRPPFRALALACLVGAALVFGSNAWAEPEPDVEAARQRHQEGLEHFESGRYEEAARAFQDAQAIAPAPSNLFNLARCHQELGRITEAIEVLDLFLALDVPEGLRSDAASMREALSELQGQDAEPGSDQPTDAQGDLGTDEPRHGPTDEPNTTIDDTGDTPGDSPRPDTARPSGPRGATLAGSLGIAGGLSTPLNHDTIATAFALAFGLSVGAELGTTHRGRRMHRIEGTAGGRMQPHATGYLLEVGGSLRYGLCIPPLPIRFELDIFVGMAMLKVDSDDSLVIANGSHRGLALAPSFVVSWLIVPWLELYIEAARLELLWLPENVTSSQPAVRFGATLGLRIRLG